MSQRCLLSERCCAVVVGLHTSRYLLAGPRGILRSLSWYRWNRVIMAQQSAPSDIYTRTHHHNCCDVVKTMPSALTQAGNHFPLNEQIESSSIQCCWASDHWLCVASPCASKLRQTSSNHYTRRFNSIFFSRNSTIIYFFGCWIFLFWNSQFSRCVNARFVIVWHTPWRWSNY